MCHQANILVFQFNTCVSNHFIFMSKATQWHHVLVWSKPIVDNRTPTRDLSEMLSFKFTEKEQCDYSH